MTTQRPVAAINSNTDANSYSFSAFTPTANALLVVMFNLTGTSVAGSVSDSSALTWTSREATTSTATYEIWTAQAPASPGSITISIATGDAGNATGCLAECWETDAHDASAPYVQSTSDDTGTASDVPQFVFGSALDSRNIYFGGVFQTALNPNVTQPSGWTKTSEAGHLSPLAGFTCCYRVFGESSSTVTWGGSAAAAWRTVAIEVKGQYAAVQAPNASSITINANTPSLVVARNVVVSSAASLLFGATTPVVSVAAPAAVAPGAAQINIGGLTPDVAAVNSLGPRGSVSYGIGVSPDEGVSDDREGVGFNGVVEEKEEFA